jgi:hypothetical protein
LRPLKAPPRISFEDDESDQDGPWFADPVLMASSEEALDQLAEQEAKAEVISSTFEGIPLDKEGLKARLLTGYFELRAKAAN